MRYQSLRHICLVLIAATAPAQAAPGHENLAQSEKAPGRSEEPAAPPVACPERPWYCDVSEADQERAVALYQEGNQLFDDSLFTGAVARYQAALEHWDHPGIHYNLMLALVALDRPLEAHESSMAALRHGPGALQPEEHQRARDYQALLSGRLAEVEITCNEPGAIVTLNGQEIFRGPGSARSFVLPGQHELVARKPGYLTSHRTVLLMPDTPVQVEILMLPAAQATIKTRRWKTWKPWAVVGAGVGVGLVGGALEWRANVTNLAYQERFFAECPSPDGCFVPAYSPELESLQRRAIWHRRVGHGVSAAGAVAAITGLVLVSLNQPQHTENPMRRNLVRISVAPDVESGSTAVSMTLDF